MTSFFKLLLDINELEKQGCQVNRALLQDLIVITGRKIDKFQGYGTAKELRRW